MRLPFLQVPQLDMSRGRTLARILRIPEAHGIGLTVALDAWAVEEAPDGDCSGLIRDPSPAEAVALAVGWDGDPAALMVALVRVKLVEETPEGPRVVSVQRYEKAIGGTTRRSEQAARAAQVRWHGKNNAPSIPSAMPNDAKTQTQMETHREDLPPPSSAGREELRLEPQQAARRKRPKVAKHGPPPDPRHAPLVQALAETGHVLLREDFRHVKELLALADQTPETSGELAQAEVLRRWAIGRAWRWGNGEAPVQSLRRLVACWNECRSEETAPPARARQPQRGPAPPSSFDRPPPVFERSPFAPEVSDEPF